MYIYIYIYISLKNVWKCRPGICGEDLFVGDKYCRENSMNQTEHPESMGKCYRYMCI